MAQNSTKINSLLHNCSYTPSAMTTSHSIANNTTDNQSKRIITESHQNSWQTALLYISIILSIYVLTIMFIGLRYALNRYYYKTFDWCCCPECPDCCQNCSAPNILCFRSTDRRRNDYFTTSPSSSRMAASETRNCNSAVYLSPDDLNTIEVTQTDEGLLETDL